MRRLRQFIFPLAVIAVLTLFAVFPKADVTGFFGTHIMWHPVSNLQEISKLEFDIQNDLTVTFAVSGLVTTFHAHFGIAGIEDAQIDASATIGALDIQSRTVFCRFGFGEVDPFYDDLHFCSKLLWAQISLGGVMIENHSAFQDTNAFISQTPAYAFGDVVRVTGQTPSGITISAETGICMQMAPFAIKKHIVDPMYSVNPDCGTSPKPDLLFDFEKLFVSNVPIAPGIVGSANLQCIRVAACQLNSTISFSGGPIPFSTSFSFTDLLSLDFGGAVIQFVSGVGSLGIGITPAGLIGAVSVSVNATLNPDTNPATLTIDAVIVPGTGLTDAVVGLSVVRQGLLFNAEFIFGWGPPAMFEQLNFSVFQNLLNTVTFEAEAQFIPEGLLGTDIWITVIF